MIWFANLLLCVILELSFFIPWVEQKKVSIYFISVVANHKTLPTINACILTINTTQLEYPAAIMRQYKRYTVSIPKTVYLLKLYSHVMPFAKPHAAQN